LHAANLQTAAADATIGRNEDVAMPRLRHEVAPAPCIGVGCGRAGPPTCGQRATTCGRPTRRVPRRREDRTDGQLRGAGFPSRTSAARSLGGWPPPPSQLAPDNVNCQGVPELEGDPHETPKTRLLVGIRLAGVPHKDQ
jgi:hypothetical protein